MADKKLSKQATGKRKSTQPKLSNFFSKSIKKSIDSSPSGSGRNSVDETPDNTKIDDSSRNTTNSSDLILAEAVGASVSVYDIGNFVGRPIDDFTKEQLLVKHWKPPKDYVFPCVVVKKNGKDSYRRPSHDLFTQFEWLVFSEKQNGLFCVYCALFASTVAGGNTLKNLVTKPVSDYKHLLGKDGYLTTHSNNVYHRTSIEKGKEFLRRINNPNLQLEHQLNKQNQDNIVENREKLKSILKCALFLGVQNIPFRGHRDDGDVLLNSNSEENASNDGNFRELIRFRIDAGDSVLAKHLEAAPGNAKYTSKTVQNELISCCAEEITETILARVNQSKWFSIVFDETTDVSHQSQLTFALRYVYENNIYEDFIGFLNPREEKLSHENEQCARVVADKPLTGEAIGSIVLNLMEKYGLSKTDCVGVATDGCSTMVSEAKGAVSTILKTCKNAVHCICFNHALNLTVSKSSKVIHVKRCLGVIKSVVAFFTASSKRNTVLKDIVGRQLIEVCETRWIERQTSIFLFQKHLQGINDALIRVSEWDEVDTATTAHSLHLSLMDSSFIVTIKCLTNIMSIMLPLSRLFQKKTIDVNFARNAVKETTDLLQEKRQKSNEAFRILFSEAEELATSLNTNISIPRLANKQTKRDNYTTDNPMDYYRVAVFNPILDHVLSDVKDRFSSTKSLVVHNFLAMFIPAENKLLKNLVMNAEVKIKLSEIANEFSFVVESRELLEGEFLHWSNKWMMAEERREKVPDSALQALKECDEDIYPTINALLRILCSLPVSVATAERSFSTLRLVKDWMRSTMTENRLNGLCSIYVHRNIVKKLSYDKIIDRFAKKNKRRLGLIL